MAKQGLKGKNITSILKDVQSTTGWALCIGAGSSIPVFPSWNELVESLVAEKVGKVKATSLAKRLLMKFGPDSLIQAAYDVLSLSDDEFVEILSNELYSKVKLNLGSAEWQIFVQAQLAEGPGETSFEIWEEFDNICATHFHQTSAYVISKVIVDALSKNIGPTDIISFNAESLLFSFLNLFLWKQHVIKNGRKPAKHGELRRQFDFITHSISSRNSSRVPYIMCHGVVPVSNNKKREKKRLGGVEKLVFAESSYLQLANSSFSWQSSSFLDVCSKRRIVFIGVSLSDPNMRRWLSWLHSNRINELSAITATKMINSTSHYWINKQPADPNEAKWIESTVSHLGVRLIWLKDWSDLESTLRGMLGLK